MALDGAGSTVVSIGEDLDDVVTTLTRALVGCSSMCGDDPAGAQFARAYDSTAKSLIASMVAVGNGVSSIGFGVRMSATNYSRAEASSDIGGRSQPLPVPQQPAKITAGSVPSGGGGTFFPPLGWGWVAPYVGMIWPTADTGRLRAAAAAWMTAATGFVAAEATAAAPLGVVGAQQIPEVEAIGSAFVTAARSGGDIMAQANTVATELVSYAGKVDAVRTAIVKLLAEIADPLTGVKIVWDWLTDDDEQEIERIANEIRTVIDHFKTEVVALGTQIASLAAEAANSARNMSDYAAKEWDHFLHDTTVGGVFNQIGQFEEGAWKELGGMLKTMVWTYSDERKLIDPEGYQRDIAALADGLGPLVGLGGDDAPGVLQAWKDFGKETVHWDMWSENPAEAAGRSIVDIATLFIPGAGQEATAIRTTKAVTDAAEAAARAERPLAQLPRAGEVPRPPPVELPKPPAEVPKPPVEVPKTPVDVPPVTERTAPGPTSHVPADLQQPVAPREQAGPPPAPQSPAPASAAPIDAPPPAQHQGSASAPTSFDPPPPSPPHQPPHDNGRGGPVDHPGSADDLGHHGDHHSGDDADSGLTQEKRDEILATDKGDRPDPSDYLSPGYIEQHLEKFHDGACRFMPENNLEKYGIAQRDGTAFVMPKSEADALLAASGGDLCAIERSLGLPEGFLDSNNLVRIDIAHPQDYNLRIPSGNEAGANEQWIPGGVLPDGVSEAVVDGGQIPGNGYTVTDVTE